MALDFYEISDLKLKSRLFSLGEKECADLEPIFLEFQKKTSIYIDPFGDTKIHLENARLIINIAEKYQVNLDMYKDRLVIEVIIHFKQKLAGVVDGFLVVGD